MPLWPVELRPWTAGTIRSVVPTEVLVDFEGPITFTFTDEAGTPLLAHLVSRGDGLLRYVAAPTTSRTVDELRNGTRTVLSALDQPIVWLFDVGPEGVAGEVWSGALADLPKRVLPAADVMLFAHLDPILRLRAVGDRITPDSLPASVVSSVVGGAEKAVRFLVRHAAGAPGVGRPVDAIRSLYQLRAQQFAFHSFEVAFRVSDTVDLFDRDPTEIKRITAEAERLLRVGFDWLMTGQFGGNDDERQVVFEAIRELSPTQGSPIAYIEVGGRAAGHRPASRPRLTSGTRRIAGEAIGTLREGKELPEYDARVGRVVAVNVLEQTLTVWNQQGKSTFHFDAGSRDEVLDALNTQETVSTACRPRWRHVRSRLHPSDPRSVHRRRHSLLGFSGLGRSRPATPFKVCEGGPLVRGVVPDARSTKTPPPFRVAPDAHASVERWSRRRGRCCRRGRVTRGRRWPTCTTRCRCRRPRPRPRRPRPAVDLCYRPQPFPDERRRFEHLFALHERLAAPLTAPGKRGRKP